MELKHLQNGSDIRGVALDLDPALPVDFTPEQARALAHAFGSWLKEKAGKEDVTVALGRDSRLSGPILEEAVKEGLMASGAKVLRTSLSSTPAMFMATQFPQLDADGSIMLTASHMPANRNGMKFFTRDGGLDKEDVAALIALAEKGGMEGLSGSSEDTDLMDLYASHLRKLICSGTGQEQPLSGLHIVVDAGNGAGGFFASKVLEPLGADISGSQFLEPDGTFPNHIPNPENKEAMASIVQAVKDNHADLGIIFDTDVDRSSAVDSKGNPISRNALVALAALVASKNETDPVVVTDSVTSDHLETFLKDKGIVHHRFKRGYRNVINEAVRLNEEGQNAVLAIETSGHAAFRDNYFLDDGAYLATLMVLEAAKGSLESALDGLEHGVEEREVRLPILAEDFKGAGEKALADFEAWAQEQPGVTVVKPNAEGVRVRFDKEHGDGWMLMRLSLHEPLLPVNLESDTAGGTAQMLEWLQGFLKNHPELG